MRMLRVLLCRSPRSRLRPGRTRGHPRPRRPPRTCERLGDALDGIHPDLYENVTRARFRAEVDRLARRAPSLDRSELLVGLMRIAALPGVRNGHTGLFPLHPGHRRPVHLYPLRLYDFADGVFVVDSTGPNDLRGSRVVAIGGMPVRQVLKLVQPLVPRDNVWNLKGWAPHYALVAEVLDGLGIVEAVGPATFEVLRPDGTVDTVTLDPIPRAVTTSRRSEIRCTAITRRRCRRVRSRSTLRRAGASCG